MPKRISYFDALRGLAIVMVVAIHSFGNYYSYLNVNCLVLIIRNIFNVAVPVFLVISGFFLADKVMVDWKGYALFLKHQVSRVYIPILFCSIPFLYRDLNAGISAVPFVKFFSCSYSVYYFVAVIIQCYLLLPLIKKKLTVFVVLFFLSGAFWLLFDSYFLTLHKGISLPLIIYAGHIFMWGFFFCLGVLFKRKSLPQVPFKLLIPALIVCVVYSLLESNYIMTSTLSITGCGQKFSTFIANTLLIFFFLHKKTLSLVSRKENSYAYRMFTELGKYSFGIYLVHLFVLTKVTPFMEEIQFASVRWIFCTALTLVGSYFLLFICRKLSSKYTHFLLGV